MDWAKEIVSKKVFENNIVDTQSNNKYVAQNKSLNYIRRGLAIWERSDRNNLPSTKPTF